jgi:hypothetical protein
VNDESREREFLAQTRSVLDASVEAIDPATRTRLRAARTGAIERARVRRRWPLAGLVAAASAAIFAIAVWRAATPPKPVESIEAAPAPIAVAPIEAVPLAAAEDLDLYLDLDFFTWLAEDADAG